MAGRSGRAVPPSGVSGGARLPRLLDPPEKTCHPAQARRKASVMSLNDPQWGKRGRSGPPDLDEIWRNVNRRLNEMFGRTPPGEPGGVPPRRSLPLGGAGLLAALVLLVWLASGF